MKERNNQGYNSQQGDGKDDVFANIYREVMQPKHNSRVWSVLSLILGIVSIICCCVWWIGVVCGVASIAFAIVSRVSLGYFDGLSIAGLITSIFGLMFGIFIIILEFIIVNSPEYAEFLKEVKRFAEEENIELFARLRGQIK